MPYVFILAVCLRFEWLDNVCMHTQLLNRVWLFCDLMDCTLEGSSVHGIFEARIIILSVLSFRDPISSVQSLSHVQLFMTPWTAARQATLSITNSQSPPKPMSLESVRCHPTISSSVVPFSSCPQSFPASGSFQMSQLFASGGQNVGVSASTSVLPMDTQDWFPLGWTGWISSNK